MGTLGATCKNHAGCPDMWCDLTQLFGQGVVCTAPKPPGTTCTVNAGCVSGMFCDVLFGMKCVPYRSAGVTCAANYQCASNQCDVGNTNVCLVNTAITCTNGVLDSGETDVDCGGVV